jgi:hypothetical protein
MGWKLSGVSVSHAGARIGQLPDARQRDDVEKERIGVQDDQFGVNAGSRTARAERHKCPR